MNDSIKISLCIPTMNRFDTFLQKYLISYIVLLTKNIIDEIIICDETGEDYEKIMNLFGDVINNDSRIQIHKNDSKLGVFKNKLKVCSFAKHNYIALIDSDNFCDETYFRTAKNYIQQNGGCFPKSIILAPSFSKPRFNFKIFENSIVTKHNIHRYAHHYMFWTLLNTGNYILTKSAIDNIIYNDSVMHKITACDVLYFNLLLFQQSEDHQMHIVKNFEYNHVVHDDSLYLTTIKNCLEYRDDVIFPSYFKLIPKSIKYYLVCSGSKIKRENMTNEFVTHGLDPKNVVYMNYPNIHDLTENLKLDSNKPTLIIDTANASKEKISCASKHYLCLKDIVDNNYDYGVIMEDNIYFNRPDIENLVDIYICHASKQSEHWDVIFDHDWTYYIERYTNKDILVYPKINDITDQCHGGTKCSSFYLITKECAKKLYDNYNEINNAYDWTLNEMFRKLNIRSFWVEPSQITTRCEEMNINLLDKKELFYCKNKDTYPPFKNGLYLEEYFLNKLLIDKPHLTKKYIPVLWTNFQIEDWFQNKKQEMQEELNTWLTNNPSESGYFTIVQHDDGPLLQLPKDTTIYGACSGDISIPLIYQDVNNTLSSIQKRSFNEKDILCSFIGNITSNYVQPNVRQVIFDKFTTNKNFNIINSGGWTPCVNQNLQDLFINITTLSKFALSPRGYGRASFRFFECLQLGTIPVYIWNDIEWLPFKDLIDYNKLCISIHITDIDSLENKLLAITESQYNNMLAYYNQIKHLFELDGMSNKIINDNI